MANNAPNNHENNNKSTTINNNYSYSSKELLRRNCSLYIQRRPGPLITGTDYTSPPSINSNGSQVVHATNCSDSSCRTIYKPNNKQYGVQGAVDSSSRIHRLRHNTMKKGLNSISKTYSGDGWVLLEIEVLGSEKITHFLDDEAVLMYEDIQFDPDDQDAKKLIRSDNDLLLDRGHIAIQAETAPIEFRKIEM